MNKFSKAYQLRDYRAEKESKPRAWGSTLAAGKGLSPIGKRGRKLRQMDGLCADEVMSRDGFECVSHWELDKQRVNATVVHHIARKLTHKGVDVRFRLGYQVALCDECHADEHAQNGMSRALGITTVELDDGRVEQRFIRGDRSASRTVTDWNPFEVED